MTSLWSSAIKAGVISPYTILREQADALSGQTSGVLLGKVEKSFFERSQDYVGPHQRVTILTLVIVVPALEDFRVGILKAAHNEMFPYPVFLEQTNSLYKFESFIEFDDHTDVMGAKPNARSDTDDEFRSKIGKVLSSASVVSTAQALIARVEEKMARSENES